MKNDGFCGGGKEMNQKTLKKSLVALLVGIMLLSQSVYADSLALAAAPTSVIRKRITRHA